MKFSLSNRVASFVNWPQNMTKQFLETEKFEDAGFRFESFNSNGNKEFH
jgi:hypothetical protein